MPLTLGPEDLEFDVDNWREILIAAGNYLENDGMLYLTTATIDELHDVAYRVVRDYDQRNEEE